MLRILFTTTKPAATKLTPTKLLTIKIRGRSPSTSTGGLARLPP
jgi:hypothetical protein